MSPDEKPPVAENETPIVVVPVAVPAQDAHLTQEEFEAETQRLFARARAAGLNPFKTMLHSYGRRGQAMFNAFLGALEEDVDSPKKKKE